MHIRVHKTSIYPMLNTTTDFPVPFKTQWLYCILPICQVNTCEEIVKRSCQICGKLTSESNLVRF